MRADFCSYNAGLFFVTICAKYGAPFGSITVNSATSKLEMVYSPLGYFVHNDLKNLSAHYPDTSVLSFVVMPNHVHALIEIAPDNNDVCRRNESRFVMFECPDDSRDMRKVEKMKGRLSIVMSGFKSAVTRYSKKSNIVFKWQENFFDEIIRNVSHMNQVSRYISENVGRWYEDEYYV